MKTIELPVNGMDCASCASHVRTALCDVDGVVSAEVLLGAEKATVEYDEDATDVPRLAAAIAAAGYRVPADALGALTDGARAFDGGPRDARAVEAESFSRRAMAVTGLVFGAVLVVVVLGEWLGLFEAATVAVPFWVGVGVVLVVGWPPFANVLRAALRGRVIAHTLMAVGVLAALVVGQWVTAAVVAFFMRVGDFVEGFTMRKGREALRDLESMAPAAARVEADGAVEERPLGEVRPGDIVVVRPGDHVPVDGEVVEGRASVEQAAITGEAMPVDVEPGSQVYTATAVRGGALRVRTERVGAESTFGQIIRMVEQAESHRGRIESFADRFSGWYLPIVATVAVLTYGIGRDPLATAAVLVVACSCAFALATPVAMLATIGSAARKGLLIKGGAYIEALAAADVILVDKTGTFTVGRPVVYDIVSLDGMDPDGILALAAAAERDSEHPLAAAIRAETSRRKIAVEAPAGFEALEGLGVAASVGGRRVVVGNEAAVGLAAPPAEAEALRRDGATTVYVSVDGEPVGVLAIRDRLRPEVPAALDVLRDLGLGDIELLTGDHEAAAAPVARELSVAYRAGLLPEDKIRIVREHQAAGRTVVMIGDGVNDAPALAQADVGIAMGAAGTELALEVAHVALMRDDWSLVPEAFRTARRTMGVVRGNFGFTGLYNVVGLTLAAVGILPPILAAAAQSIPDLGILGNSARLLRK